MSASLSITAEGAVLAREARRAGRPVERMRGLLGSPRLATGNALVIEPATQIHTFGLAYPIDVLFCDRHDRVVHVVRRMKPWRLSRWVRGARYVVELPAGAVPEWLGRGTRISVRVSEGSHRDP